MQTNAPAFLADKIVKNIYSDLIFSRDATRGKKIKFMQGSG
jgi:hypothetical protein